MTKRLIWALVLTAGLGAASARALAPEQMSYQGVLVQNNGVAVPNGVYNLRFGLYDHPTAGILVFEQTLSAQVTSGLYNVILSNNAGYDLGDVVAANAQLFMQVTVLANPPSVPSAITLLPRQQLASVPYALATVPPPPDPPPPGPTPPGIVEAQTLPFSTETPFTANDWTPLTALSELTLQVPSTSCVVEVRAEVVVGSDGGTDTVGVRLEQSYNGATYAEVRKPVIVTTDSDGNTASTTHVAQNLAAGTYVYRVSLRESGTADFEVNPVVGGLGATQSTLSGKLWCP
jgi:hypothetical protein